MTEINVNPDAIRSGGGAVADISAEFLQATKTHLANVGDMSQCGRNDLLAAALQLVYGSVLTVAGGVVDSHVESLEAYGQLLEIAAKAYQNTENSNVELITMVKAAI